MAENENISKEEVKEAEAVVDKEIEKVEEAVGEAEKEEAKKLELPEDKKLTREERDDMEVRVNDVMEKIRPYIQHDGGDCELLGVDENNVAYVTFLGACAGCMMAGSDFSSGIRLLLLDEIPELTDVVLVG